MCTSDNVMFDKRLLSTFPKNAQSEHFVTVKHLFWALAYFILVRAKSAKMKLHRYYIHLISINMP